MDTKTTACVYRAAPGTYIQSSRTKPQSCHTFCHWQKDAQIALLPVRGHPNLGLGFVGPLFSVPTAKLSAPGS